MDKTVTFSELSPAHARPYTCSAFWGGAYMTWDFERGRVYNRRADNRGLAADATFDILTPSVQTLFTDDIGFICPSTT
jgi:hypothetical protein